MAAIIAVLVVITLIASIAGRTLLLSGNRAGVAVKAMGKAVFTIAMILLFVSSLHVLLPVLVGILFIKLVAA